MSAFPSHASPDYSSFSYQYTTDTLGEPLNIIISSKSDPDILTESGMQNYIKYVLICFY